MRPDKAEAFFGIAEAVSKLSKDPSTRVGCILLDPETLSVRCVGYNGMPRKIDESIDLRWQRPEKYSFVSHAEANAVALSAYNSTPTKDATCVVTMFPCVECSKMLIQAGIKKIVTKEPNEDLIERWGESFKYSKILLSEAGIDIQYV